MKKIFLSLAAVAALFAACSQDDENVTPVPETEDKGILEFGASLPSTRTYLNGNDVYWSADDKLTVWSDNIQSPRTYVLKDGAKTPTANFIFTPTSEVPTGVSGKNFYAIYPQNPKTTVSGNAAYIELPATQKCNDINKTQNFLPTYNPMAAMTTDDLNGMVFKNLCAIVVVDVTPDQDLTLTKIVLETADSKALCGAATVTLTEPTTAESVPPTIEMTEVTETNQQITLACENMALKANEKYSFYVVVPPAAYNDFGIKIYTNKKRNEPSLYKVRTKQLDLKAGMITTVGANFKLITAEPVKYKVGDKYPYTATTFDDVQGFVFSVDNPDAEGRSLSGKIMAVKDCGSDNQEYTWGPATGTILTPDATDGSVNMTLIGNAITLYPAFKACADLTTGGLSWYLPAKDELNAIMTNYTAMEVTWRQVSGIEDTDIAMLPALNYWSSTVGGSKVKTVSYYSWESNEEGAMETVSVSKLATQQCAVRAVAKFTSK